MDATEGTHKLIAVVEWDGDDGRREARNYGFWTPKDNMSHLEEVRTFILAEHGGAPGIETTLYMVEDVTATFNAAHLPGHVKEATTPDEKKISIAANSIGYALQEASVELDAELVLKAAQRLADQGLLK